MKILFQPSEEILHGGDDDKPYILSWIKRHNLTQLDVKFVKNTETNILQVFAKRIIELEF